MPSRESESLLGPRQERDRFVHHGQAGLDAGLGRISLPAKFLHRKVEHVRVSQVAGLAPRRSGWK